MQYLEDMHFYVAGRRGFDYNVLWLERSCIYA